jgi:putative aldouronate transport system substrate-binding protein
MMSTSRRGFIRLLAGGTLVSVALPLLAACTPPAPQASSTTSNSAPATVAPKTAAKTRGVYPTYAPAPGPKPDFPAAGPLYEDGFSTYPKNPSKVMTGTPGLGSKVTSYTNNSAPAPPTPVDQNPAWQEVNKQLNADVQYTIIAQADYRAKLATVMAGNDLPDFMLIPGPAATGIGIQGLTQFLERQTADLTPYLGGDAAKDYPYLAAIPTYAWKNSGSARNGKLYMVPIQRYYPGSMLLKNAEVYDKAIGKDYTPKNADDFKRVLQQLNKPAENQWAIGSYLDQMYYIYFFAAMFGAPNNWGLDANGKLVKDIETPQYKEALAYTRDLVVAGLFQPDALSIADSTRARDAFIGSKFVLDVWSFGNAWQDAWTRGPKLNPPVTPQAVLPFPAHDGQKAQHYFGKGFFGNTVMKKASPDRIEELLRIMNWLAAPFGSAEDVLLTIGVPEVDYTVDAAGTITPTPRSNTDANSVPWKYIVQRPQVAFWTGIPDYARAATDFEKAAIPVGVVDPVLGYQSAAWDSKGAPLVRALIDATTDVLAGRRQVSEWDQIVKDWQTNGGNAARTEFEQAIAADA